MSYFHNALTKIVLITVFALMMTPSLLGQGRWQADELFNAFDGENVQPTLLILNEKGITAYDFGFQLYSSNYSRKSLLWFRKMAIEVSKTNEHDALQYLYGFAFVSWAIGDKDGAVTDLTKILSKEPNDLILARSYYLLATIERSKLNMNEARAMLHKSITLYKKLDLPGGLSRGFRMLATCALESGNHAEALEFLEKSRQSDDEAIARGFRPLPKGRTYEINAQVLMAKQEYSKALELFQRSYEEYSKNPEGSDIGVIEVHIAFLILITGHPSRAADLCRDIHQRYSLAGNSRVLAYNAIIAMKMSMCANLPEDAARHEADIRSWAESNTAPAKQVLAFMELVKKDEARFPCPKWR